ncbi:envelope stress response membrane protein PspC [Croceicoccus ponticola]|uniref:Envelope stress response membrane protein PspC n=1 Tax=Croceicoccus ponticola TaxID=2217664 RepID=A0A437GU80_9SPHN|nr:envelope stress response membrane protein PspC [Croceicoccus ponticola]RVQ64873.1 envelope stress response membrane protein PspC [Croceicoccus ponticola]
MNTPRTRFYRNKADGKFMGVCSGIADYTGVDALWVRVGFAVAMVTMGWPILVYLAIGILAPKKPAELYADKREEKFWQGVRRSPARSAREVRASFREIDRRLARVEEHYVSSNRSLSAEIENLR